ncbi:MAG: hypothetical protein II689_00365, partial [Firmicutes bacterium]|nr:hypothetical protein [Bacillota bacterium]
MRVIIAAALIFSCCASAFALGDLPSIDAYVDVPAEADGGSVFVATYDANGAFTGIKTGDAGSFPTSPGGESIITVDDCANPGSVKAFFLSNEGLSPVSASGLPSRLDAYATVDLSGGTYGVVTIPEAVGNGSIQLTDVTITEELRVLGGGSNTLTLVRCTLPKIVADKEQTANDAETPRILLQETDVPLIEATEPVIIEAQGESTVEQVSASADVEIRGTDINVNTIVVTEEAPADVTISASSADVDIVVNSDKGVSITGENVTVSTDLETQPPVELNGQTLAHVHSWDEGTITTAPARGQEGEKTFHCDGCDETKTETIPALKFDPLPEGAPYFAADHESLVLYFEPQNLNLTAADLPEGQSYLRLNEYIDKIELYI